MLTKTELTGLDFSDRQSDLDWSFSGFSRPQTNAFSHNYHRYPAKFIPQIVRRLIEQYTSPGDLVVDPFGGCGTTLVEAKMLDRRSIGLDINPVAKFITQTKITPMPPQSLEVAHKLFLRAYSKDKTNPRLVYHPRISYWFEPEVIVRLERIYNAIFSVNDYVCRRFYLCAFSNILKNSSRWLMKSIKPTVDQNKLVVDPYLSFERHLKHMVAKNELFYEQLSSSGNLDTYTKVYQRDARRKWNLPLVNVDLIITSPPYVTSYEYADLHQLSLIWFGSDVQNFKHWHNQLTGGLASFKAKFIGTSIKPKQLGQLNSPIAQDAVSSLLQADQSLAKSVANYFLDMQKAFRQMYNDLKPGGVVGIILGNTTLRGIEVRNAEAAYQQMSAIGFQNVDVIKRQLSKKMAAPYRDMTSGKFTSPHNPNNHRIYEYEYIITMRKP